MTRRAGVIGHPVHHSLSPMIHAHWIKRYGLDARYDAIDIAPENLQEGVMDLVRKGYAGLNVTLPHKQAVMNCCARIDPAARSIGAVNTLVLQDGQWHGRNTDADGFMENLKRRHPAFQGPALVLGAGGAARAAVYALARENVENIILCNRTASHAESLARKSFCRGKARVAPWQDRATAAKEARLIVNTTSLGMTGHEPLEMDLSGARPGAIVYDIVYRPLMTDLLRQAERLGLPVVTGSGMLLHQARPAFQAWFGILPEVESDLVKMIESVAQS